MRSINLISILNAKQDLSQERFYQYLNWFGIDEDGKEQNKKEQELHDIKSLIDSLENIKKNNIKIYDSYYYGFKIPQIGKEFDLLRFGEDFIINIELKSQSTTEKIKQQLLKNNYYLKFLNKKVYSFTYVSENKKLYHLNNEDKLIEYEFKNLIDLLDTQKLDFTIDIDKSFKPSDYLISPFNSTDEFMENQYFLTNQQKEIKNNIKKLIEKNDIKFFSIEGSAGTGKTLLAYDIAKEFINDNKNVILIHCGCLNDGHNKLNTNYGWNIIPAKNIGTVDLTKYDFIFIDEVQRMFQSQLISAIDSVKSSNNKCIFSYDRKQCLSSKEIEANNIEYIEKNVFPSKFKLKDKIRTNKEIASFITNLFDLYKINSDINYSNINIQYFSDEIEVKAYLRELSKNEWEVINYTPGVRGFFYYEYYRFGFNTAHRAIGQEYDKVAVVMDDHFGYDIDGKLSVKNISSCYYSPTKMLFQILTRTRNELTLVILNNEELLRQCIQILKPE